MPKRVSLTPSQRTQSWLEEQGYRTGTVERFIQTGGGRGTGYRKDLFGAFDLLAIRPGLIVAVQSTGTDWSGHWKKLTAGDGREGVQLWLSTGQPAMLIGWRQLKAGWLPRVHFFLPCDLVAGSDPQRHRSLQQWWEGAP